MFAHPIISGKSVEEAQKIFKAHFTSVILRAWLVSKNLFLCIGNNLQYTRNVTLKNFGKY